MADSGHSSPHSAEDGHHDGGSGSDPAAAAAAAAVAELAQAPAVAPLPPVPAKVRLMVSYGGRIQPRPHDNQLAYVSGDTKILSIERPLRFADFAARLAALAGARGDICVKYQLPGEDLDALVSVTNDEDLEHLVLEYDRLHLLRAAPGSGGGGSSRGGSTPRLRVFLFPVQLTPQPPGLLEPKQEQRTWFVDALNNVNPPQQQPPQETVTVQSPPPAAPQSTMVAAHASPDYLFGLDYGHGFVLPPAVKVKDPATDPSTTRENIHVEIPPKNDDRHPHAAGDHAVVSPVVSPADFQRQIQDLDKLQFTDNTIQQAPSTLAAPIAPAVPAAPTLPRNGSDDSLTRAYPPTTTTPAAAAEYYIPKFPEKPPVPPPSTAPPATAFLPVPGRYASVAPGSGNDQGPFFFIPAPPHGYFATTSNSGGTSFYAVSPHNGNVNGAPSAPSASKTPAYPQVAYDSNGRAIYYTNVLPQYPSAVNGMSSGTAPVLGTEPAKPVAVKPTVS